MYTHLDKMAYRLIEILTAWFWYRQFCDPSGNCSTLLLTCGRPFGYAKQIGLEQHFLAHLIRTIRATNHKLSIFMACLDHLGQQFFRGQIVFVTGMVSISYPSKIICLFLYICYILPCFKNYYITFRCC